MNHYFKFKKCQINYKGLTNFDILKNTESKITAQNFKKYFFNSKALS